MRRREASNDKNWCPGNDAIPGLAASLDRIFKKVNSEGLSDETADELAADIAECWKQVWLDPTYRLYVFGTDDPAELPITGRHGFVVLGYQLAQGEMTEELIGRCDAAAAAARLD